MAVQHEPRPTPHIHRENWQRCPNKCTRGMVASGQQGRILGRSHGVTLRSSHLMPVYTLCPVCDGQGRVKVGGGQ